jgi:GST-like protein
VLDSRLANSQYLACDHYTIADIACWPWYGGIMNGSYNAQEFLSVHEYAHVRRWVDQIGSRPAVQRGRRVNSTSVPAEQQVRERHSAVDFNT